MADIFIAYARPDRPFTQKLAAALEAQQWTVFWDQKIPSGRRFEEVISTELKAARCVVALWSKSSVDPKRTWVREEASFGAKREILHPVLIDEVDPPLGFGFLQAANLVKWEPGVDCADFDRLLADITATLARSAPPVEAALVPAERPKRGPRRSRGAKATSTAPNTESPVVVAAAPAATGPEDTSWRWSAAIGVVVAAGFFFTVAKCNDWVQESWTKYQAGRGSGAVVPIVVPRDAGAADAHRSKITPKEVLGRPERSAPAPGR
jgi:hypothetical protein